jgi:hypothetical protein
VLCTIPDLRERVKLSNRVRRTFRPRDGHVFCVVEARDLYHTLLAWYCRDQELLAAIPQGKFLAVLAQRTSFTERLCHYLVRQITEGHGAELLERRLRLEGIRYGGDKKALYGYGDHLKKHLGKHAEMVENLNAMLTNGCVPDRVGRRLRIDEKRRWRAVAMLLQSSFGGVLTFYLDLLCRAGAGLSAQLLLAHENEFVFEMPQDKAQDFVQAVGEIARRQALEPAPHFVVHVGPTWQLPAEPARKE